MFDIVFTNEPTREIHDYRAAMGNADLLRRYTILMRERGVLKGESKYYIGLCHTDADVTATLTAFDATLVEMKRAKAA